MRVVDRAPGLPWLAPALALFLDGASPGWFPDSLGDPVTSPGTSCRPYFALALLLRRSSATRTAASVRKLLANRVLLWVGLVSYGVYLWHVAVMRELTDRGALDSLELLLVHRGNASA